MCHHHRNTFEAFEFISGSISREPLSNQLSFACLLFLTILHAHAGDSRLLCTNSTIGG